MTRFVFAGDLDLLGQISLRHGRRDIDGLRERTGDAACDHPAETNAHGKDRRAQAGQYQAALLGDVRDGSGGSRRPGDLKLDDVLECRRVADVDRQHFRVQGLDSLTTQALGLQPDDLFDAMIVVRALLHEPLGHFGTRQRFRQCRYGFVQAGSGGGDFIQRALLNFRIVIEKQVPDRDRDRIQLTSGRVGIQQTRQVGFVDSGGLIVQTLKHHDPDAHCHCGK